MLSNEWWRPAEFARRRPLLEKRARVLAAVRAYFTGEGFVEVETPCLQICPGTETHIMALSTKLSEPLAMGSQAFYLHTSPELAMKKLLAAGMSRIFQIAHVWRDGERSPLHHPEFTMLEWYRAHAGYEALMEDCGQLLRLAAAAAGVDMLRRGERYCDPLAAPNRLTVAAAFQQYCGIDLLATTPVPQAPNRALLADELRRIGLTVGENDTWEDLFFRVMLDRIEPFLGDGVAVILSEYPLSLAALSRPSPRDARVAERFELYACGIELANGFGELTDADETRRRFARDMAEKQRLYGVSYPQDDDFVAALRSGLPDCAGIALGLDRLVMLATGAETIEDILWVPVMVPKPA